MENWNKPFRFNETIEYAGGAVVSKTIIKKPSGTITLFSFDQGQGLSPHKAPFDALVQVLDGACTITIEEESFELVQGESIILPADKIHSLEATSAFKMLLTMIKGGFEMKGVL